MSNVGHWVEGGLIAAGGALLLRDALSDGEGSGPNPHTFLATAGGLLALALVGGSFHHGGPATFFKNDAQQREHLQMAALVTAGSLAPRVGPAGDVLSGLATARIGQMFLTHEQHGTNEAARKARAKHQRLGKTILGGALFKTMGELFGNRVARAAGAGLLIVSGVLLLSYREPEGAFEGSSHAAHEDSSQERDS